MRVEVMLRYMRLIAADQRLTVWHIAILMAIIQLGLAQGQEKTVKVSRSAIMRLSHVTTLPTYHKYLKDLQALGYIKYTPSYHPGFRSVVEILL